MIKNYFEKKYIFLNKRKINFYLCNIYNFKSTIYINKKYFLYSPIYDIYLPLNL